MYKGTIMLEDTSGYESPKTFATHEEAQAWVEEELMKNLDAIMGWVYTIH